MGGVGFANLARFYAAERRTLVLQYKKLLRKSHLITGAGKLESIVLMPPETATHNN
jgi:hypothetical protein